MSKFFYIAIILMTVGCTVQSSKCTNDDVLHLSDAGFSSKEIDGICNNENSATPNQASESVFVFRSPKSFDRNVDEQRINLELGESYGKYTLETSGQLIHGTDYLFNHKVLYEGRISTVQLDYRVHLGHVSDNGLYQILYAGDEKGDHQMLVYYLNTGHISKPHPLMSAYAAGFSVWNTQSTKVAVISGGEVPDLSVFKVKDESWADFHFYRDVDPWGVEGVFDQSVNDCGWQVIDNLKWLSEYVLRVRLSIIENPWGIPDAHCQNFKKRFIEVTADANTAKYTINTQY